MLLDSTAITQRRGGIDLMDFPEKGLQYRILWYWFCDIIIFSSEAGNWWWLKIISVQDQAEADNLEEENQ